MRVQVAEMRPMSVDFYSYSKIRDPSEINAVDSTHDPDELGQL